MCGCVLSYVLLVVLVLFFWVFGLRILVFVNLRNPVHTRDAKSRERFIDSAVPFVTSIDNTRGGISLPLLQVRFLYGS